MPGIPTRVALCCLWCAVAALPQTALRIVRPAAGQIITTNSLLIEAECDLVDDSVVSMEFITTYFTAGYQPGSFISFYQQVVDSVLHTTHTAPYQWIWDISDLQDQYHHRMSVGVVAYTARGDTIRRTVSDFVVDRTSDPTPHRELVCRYGIPPPAAVLNPDMPAAQYKNGDNTVTFQCCWTADTLYVLVSVYDPSIVCADSQQYAPQQRAWWYGDVVELFVDPTFCRTSLVDTTTYQLLLHPDGVAYGGYCSLTHHPLRFNLAVSGGRTAEGYEARCAVPWERLGLRPRHGMRIGFEVSNVDLDKRDGLYSVHTWSGLHIGNHHNASEWGALLLTAPRVPTWARIPGACVAALLIGVLLWVVWRRRADAIAVAPVSGDTFAASQTGPLVASMVALVKTEYHDEDLNLQFVASRLHKNPKYLSTLFKKETGVSFTAFLNRIRLEEADRLLRTTSLSISHISLEVGYGSYKYFSAVYRKHYGMSPSDVRRQG